MLDPFKAHIKENFPALLQNKLLVACSGGLDSVALTHLCHAAGLTIALAHCNFGLRDAESDGDALFVKELGEQLGVTVFVTRFDTLGHANQYGVSVQMAARELRYAWFTTLLETHGFDKILTAHHLDDALETFLINLSRGTGIDGLTGIPQQTDTLTRPLLPFSREELLHYAKANKLRWREDSSNTDTKYLRNKIRAGLIPMLKELHPSFLENFKVTTANLGQTSAMVKNELTKTRNRLFQSEKDCFKIATADLKQLLPLNGYLYGLFEPYGFTEWQNLRHLLDAMSGKYIQSKTHTLLKDREHVWLCPLQHNVDETPSYLISQKDLNISQPIPLALLDVTERKENTDTIIYVAKNALKYPLQVRKWKKGDYFYPLGLNRKKKLAKYFKDEKVPVPLKDKQWVLCSGEDIVWVIGKRADERFKVQKTTEQIVKIEVSL